MFRGKITHSNIIKLKKELSRIIKPKEDFISILKMINEDVFSEDVIGTKPEESDSLIL